MRLSIDIAQDEQLRNEIRNIIDSQVRNILREELQLIVEEYFNKQMSNNNTKLQCLINSYVNELLNKTFGYNRSQQENNINLLIKSLLQNITKEEIKKILSENPIRVVTETFELTQK